MNTCEPECTCMCQNAYNVFTCTHLTHKHVHTLVWVCVCTCAYAHMCICTHVSGHTWGNIFLAHLGPPSFSSELSRELTRCHSWGQRDSATGKVLALHAMDPSSISVIIQCALSFSGML